MISKRISSILKRQIPRAFASNDTLTIELPERDYFLLEDGQIPSTTETNKEELLNYFREMTIMRRMEIVCDSLYKDKQIFGFCHLYDGQEATAMGIEEALTFDDAYIGAYRIHCQAYLRGISLFEIFAEMLGKQGGSSKGKGGSMHYYKKETNFFGGNGIVGAQVPVGTGIAFANQYLGKPNVCVATYGDGAANQGQIFEAANMAYLWKLPMIYVCENNQYGMGTSTERAASSQDFHQRMNPVPGITVDGLNIFDVREAVKFAKQHALEHGPIALNILTYRYHGHSMSDPGTTYRTRDEVQTVRKTTDCLLYLKRLTIESGFATEKEIKAIEKEVRQIVDKAAKDALAQDDFPIETLTHDIYAPGDQGKCPRPNPPP